MVTVSGESVPAYATVKTCFTELKRGLTGIEDKPRSGRPK